MTICLAYYLWFVAADQYVAEFRYSVNQSTPALPGTATPQVGMSQAAGALSNLASMMGGSSAAVTPGASQNFVVADYLTSQQAVDDLQRRIDVKSLYSRRQIDWWSRFDPSKPIENFLQYFTWYLYSDYDQVTGLAVARVRAFTPHDAWLIASTMAKQAEGVVNEVNTRANQDAVRFAENEAAQARLKLDKVNAELLQFRTEEATVNPYTSLVSTNTQMDLMLRTNLVSLQTQLGSFTQGGAPANSPAAKAIADQIASTKQQIQQIENQIGRDSDQAHALAKVVGRWEELSYQQQYWQSMLTQTAQALELARANAAAQHLYLEPYVMPEVPESSTYPNRPLYTGIGFLCIFGFWLACLLVVRAIQDHAV